MTECFSATPLLSSQDLSTVTKLLIQGELVAIPTETVYGLAALLSLESGVKKIFHVKNRPADNPLIVHISSLKQLSSLILPPPPLFYTLTQFWPGPLTLITHCQPSVSPFATAHLPSIAIRMPAHPCALQIIDNLNAPIVAPSANRSGFPSPTTARDVLEDLQGLIPAVVDGGSTQFGIESTVISLLDERPTLLRPGALSRELLEETLKQKLATSKKAISPGMNYRHYAPKAKVLLLSHAESIPDAYLPTNLSEKNLYMHLRTADRLGYSAIAIVLTAEILSNEALMDRLLRAAGGGTLPQCSSKERDSFSSP